MENTTKTKNDIENGEMKMQSKNKSKERMKNSIKRDATALERSAEALKSLASSTHVDSVQDKDFVKHNLDTILELKKSGIGYATIHQKLVETVGLRISIATLKGYVHQYKAEQGLVERRSKNSSKKIQISIPQEFEAGLLQFVERLNGSETHKVVGTCIDVEGKIAWQVPVSPVDAGSGAIAVN